MTFFRNYFFKVFILSFLICSSGSVGAQAYNFNYLSLQEGLSQSQAYTIYFDSESYAWIGTQGGGVCRYDGENFTYLTKNDSLISNRIYTVKEIGGDVWIGQNGGVSVFSINGEFKENYRLDDLSIQIRDLIQINESVYAATNNGVYTFDNDLMKPFEKNINLVGISTFKFFDSKDRGVWVCSQKGLLSLDRHLDKLNMSRGLPTSHIECAVEFDGMWLLGTYAHGVQCYNGDFFEMEALSELKNDIVLSLYNLGDRELWIGTLNNGVYRYDSESGVLKNFRTTNGLSGNHVRVVTADKWENIWIGTSGGGVSVFQNSPFIKYNSSSGLNGNYVFAVLNDSRDNLWLGTEGMGVLRINDTSRVLFDNELGFYEDKVKSIFEDDNGYLWFGTEGKGLGVYSPYEKKDTIFSFYKTSGFRGNWVKSFSEDKKSGIVYISTNDAGIFQIEKGKGFPYSAQFKRIKTEKKIPGRIGSISYSKGKLWFVCDDGSYGYVENGDATILYEKGVVFRNIAISDDHVWLGSTDNGVLSFDVSNDSLINKSWINFRDGRTAIESNNIYQLLHNKNQLWVGTEKGLDRLDLDSNNNWLNTEHFGFEEGLEGVETNINASSVDGNGDLWFGTVDGLFVYKGLKVNPAQKEPPLLKLNDIQIGFKSINDTPYSDCFNNGSLDSALTLEYNDNYLSFVFKSIHFSYTSDIKYRWKLDGVDEDWVPATKINIATYPNLAPGKYMFSVQSAIDDNWEPTTQSVEFVIDQPYWEKFWFKWSYYTLIIALIVLVILFIVKRQRKKSRELNEKLRLEKDLLELEQKALRLQMNPHFIFNVLNSIHNLIILNDSNKARYALSKFSKLMRQVLENSREKFISIDEEIETLQNYVQLERLTSNVEIDLDFEVDSEVDVTEDLLPPLMIQPFVENAIIHGLKGITDKGKIQVSFKWVNDNVLECVVEDNGVGRKKAGELIAQKDAYHKSTALKVTQERLANLNKESEFVPFEIHDLRSELGEVRGTKVILRILV